MNDVWRVVRFDETTKKLREVASSRLALCHRRGLLYDLNVTDVAGLERIELFEWCARTARVWRAASHHTEEADMATMAIREIMPQFTYDHLPDHLAEISRPFCELALKMQRQLPESMETYMTLRKIMEAKDCAVRSYLSARSGA